MTRLPSLALPAALALGLAASTLSPASAEPPPDDTVPAITIDSAPSKLYPAVDGYRDTALVVYTASDAVDTMLDVHVVIRDGVGTSVAERTSTDVESGATIGWEWDGGDFVGGTLPGGDYVLEMTAVDEAGNTSATDSRSISLDEGRLVDRTARGWIKAKPSMIGKDVRRCSTLKGRVRGWAGSLGYYANTRCGRTGVPSVVSTVHGVYVPEAFKDRQRGWFYGSMQIRTWGGNAEKRRGSKAILQYWKDGSWAKAKTMGSSLGTHAGRKTSAKPFIVVDNGRPVIIWGLGTANRNWYDVKKFSLTLRYQKMVYPDVVVREAPSPFTMQVPTGLTVPAPQLP
ncbi:hypothetical protein [Nocardioides aestuarii]|uniref:FlgD Ig-like domain-containing protein n=1 Tax=Nocardioides aestuarii TaxID=252231 RepID=A0ABW4TNB2_9ACTN